MKNKDLREKSPSPAPEDAFLVNPVASTTDVTGYAPVIPISDSEAESYGELFDVPCIASKKVEKELTHVLPGKRK